MDVNLSIEQHPPETLCDCEYDIGSTTLSSLYRIIKDRNVEFRLYLKRSSLSILAVKEYRHG